MNEHGQELGHEFVSEPMFEADSDIDIRFFRFSDTDSDMDLDKVSSPLVSDHV